MTSIELLADHVEVIPTLAGWYRTEWAPYYGAGGPGDAHVDLESRCNRDGIPIGLVAMKDDRICGTVALGLDEATNLTPSVIGLLVGPDHRGRGTGNALIRAAADLARELGFGRIYISTTVLGAVVSRLGWRLYGEVEFLNEERGSVYVRDLDNCHL